MNIYTAPSPAPAIFGLCLSFVIYDVKFGQISISTTNHTDILAWPVLVLASETLGGCPGWGWSEGRADWPHLAWDLIRKLLCINTESQHIRVFLAPFRPITASLHSLVISLHWGLPSHGLATIIISNRPRTWDVTRQTVRRKLTHWKAYWNIVIRCYQPECVLFDLLRGRRALGPPRPVFLNSPDWTNYWRATLFSLSTAVTVLHWKYTEFYSNWMLFQSEKYFPTSSSTKY